MTKYIKTFNKGQITIPKEIRNAFNLGDDFWLKISTEEDRIIVEPVDQKTDNSDYLNKILKIKSDWFSTKEIQKNRLAIEKRLNKKLS
jgi:AbrB family looped-hinge helix DNA binding protein